MSESNRVSWAIAEETTYGVTPTSPAPTLENIDLSGETLEQATETVESEIIRPDAQSPGTVRVGASVTGALNGELRYGVYDRLFQYLFRASAWSAAVTLTGTIYGMNATGNKLTRSSGDFTAAGFSVGRYVRTAGFSNAANNGVFRIVSIATTEIVLAGANVVTESAGASATITQGGMVQNGTTVKSFLLERSYQDLTKFHSFNGLVVAGGALAVAKKGIIKPSFTILGKKQNLTANSTVGDGSNTAAPQNESMNTVDHVTGMFEGGTALANVISLADFNVNFDNAIRPRENLGVFGPSSMGAGKFRVRGSCKAYFESGALVDKYLAFTATNFVLIFRDSAAKGYVLELPRVRLTKGASPPPGGDEDVMADFNFSCEGDIANATAGDRFTARLTRFA